MANSSFLTDVKSQCLYNPLDLALMKKNIYKKLWKFIYRSLNVLFVILYNISVNMSRIYTTQNQWHCQSSPFVFKKPFIWISLTL